MGRPDPSMFQSKQIDIQVPMPWPYAIAFFIVVVVYLAFLALVVPTHITSYFLGDYTYPSGDDMEFFFGSQVALFIAMLAIGQKADTTIRENIRKIREESPPRDARIRLDAGGVELESFWRGATVRRPTSDDLGWVFEPPGPESWENVDSLFTADPDGIIQEHPSVVGTPTPPDFTTNGILVIMSTLPLMGVAMTIPPLLALDSGSAFIIMPILFAIFTAVSLVTGKRSRAAIEVPTQKVRSIAIGDAEVIGQVRPLSQPPTVVVDNDPSKTAEDLVVWNWLYDVYIEETYINSDGERETRRYWRDIDSESGDETFVTHDGTGGMIVEPGSFSRKKLGQPIITWSCSHSSYAQLRKINLWRAVRTYGSGRVIEHRWRLWGLSIGDPCMIHGSATTLQLEATEKYGITKKDPPNSRIALLGTDSEAMKTTIWRGTELTNVALAESAFETAVIPVIMTLFATTASIICYLAL